MNTFLQQIFNLFNSISIRFLLVAGGLLILLQVWKSKFSASYKAYQKRKRLRDIEKQMWWIE